MHDYRTSRAIQEERLRQATRPSRGGQPVLPILLRRLHQTFGSLIASIKGLPRLRRHKERTA